AGDITTDAVAGTIIVNGLPSAAGTASFTVNVTDTAGATLAKDYSVVVNTALVIAPTSLPQATAGTAYNQTITVSGGTTPYTTFAVNGFNAGTTGLTSADFTTNASAGTITINGTPSGAGTASFTINVT